MDFTSTQETVAWMKDRYAEGTLSIRPPYQRNPVWMARQKCFLIESILKHLPIPEIFVQRITDDEGTTTYAVVDGQQRIRTLLQFVGADDTEDQQEFDKFPLDKLDPHSEWYNKTFSELTSAERKRIFGHRLAVRFLDSDEEEEMKEVFRRLNRFTSPLKPQELRNATYAGPFAGLANKLADDHSDYLAENRIVTAAAIRRMADIELMADLLIGTMHGPQGGTATVIDDYYQRYEDFENEFPGQRKTQRTFERVMDAIARAQPDLRETRWSNKSDFYTLFVVLAQQLKTARLTDAGAEVLRGILIEFGDQVEERLLDEEAEVPRYITLYVRNVSRAPNEKSRRAGRHAALLEAIGDSLQPDAEE